MLVNGGIRGEQEGLKLARPFRRREHRLAEMHLDLQLANIASSEAFAATMLRPAVTLYW